MFVTTVISIFNFMYCCIIYKNTYVIIPGYETIKRIHSTTSTIQTVLSEESKSFLILFNFNSYR